MGWIGDVDVRGKEISADGRKCLTAKDCILSAVAGANDPVADRKRQQRYA